MNLKDIILTADQINTLTQNTLDALTYKRTQELAKAVIDETAPLIDGEADNADRVLFTMRFVYAHGYKDGLEVFNDTVKSFTNESSALPSQLPAYLEQLSDLSREVTEENFILLQKLQADLMEKRNAGEISPAEYRALSSVAAVLRDEMREELRS